jgi:hypothetical protein
VHFTRLETESALERKTSHVNVTFSQVLCLRLGKTFDVSLGQVESFGKGLVQPSIQCSRVRKLGDGRRWYDNITYIECTNHKWKPCSYYTLHLTHSLKFYLLERIIPYYKWKGQRLAFAKWLPPHTSIVNP